ncbi:GntR family transcriptional regulator [Phytoactinopolyspora limicola]|uniref:GntR family transcriptional regulator n=1 Tax=Phytoactinopolyspora limicola TaxID=2715536 RepID=UPI00140C707F|nr:GntR family transcriptional regulator [Phytoactinopolyspora limicola]
MNSAASPRGHKHDMVRDRIMSLLENLNVGDPIPPERALGEDCGVSRLTVRRAVDDLVRDGYLTRRQGSGTYVARPTVVQSPTASSFSVGIRRRGLTPATKVLGVERADAGVRLSWRLQIAPSDQVLVIRRLRLADGEPMAIATTHLPDALVPGLPVEDLETRSLYQVLEDRYGLKVATGTQTVEPTVVSPEETSELHVPPYSPAFLFRTITRTDDGAPVEFTQTLFRGDRYLITAELDLTTTPHEDLGHPHGLARASLLE